MTIETPRLILRPWQDSDASALFRYQWTTPDVEVPLMGEVRVGHVSAITRDEWYALRT